MSEELARRGSTSPTRQGWGVRSGASRSAATARGAEHAPPLPRRRRPTRRAPRQHRDAVIDLLHQLGPMIGVPTLRECFPNMPRAELTDLLKRYRCVWRSRHYQLLHVLHWQRPGVSWAMDFAQAPHPIDGLYPYLLAVRDLASD